MGVYKRTGDSTTAINAEMQRPGRSASTSKSMASYGLGDPAWFVPPAPDYRVGVDRPEDWKSPDLAGELLQEVLTAVQAGAEAGPDARPRAGTDATAPLLRIIDLHKSFGALEVLNGRRPRASRAASASRSIGPSGSGKTTLLRCINFLERPTRGEIWIDGQRIGQAVRRRAAARALATARWPGSAPEIGFVFQRFNLFPHLTALRQRHAGAAQGAGTGRREAASSVAGEMLHQGRPRPQARRISGAAVRRPAAARRHRARAGHAAQADPVRRADLGARSRAGRRGAERHARSWPSEGRTMLIVTHEIRFAGDVADRVIFMDRRPDRRGGPAASSSSSGPVTSAPAVPPEDPDPPRGRLGP